MRILGISIGFYPQPDSDKWISTSSLVFRGPQIVEKAVVFGRWLSLSVRYQRMVRESEVCADEGEIVDDTQ